MILHDRDLIATYRARGWWGDLTVPLLFRDAARRAPQEIALIDPPNRAAVTDGVAQRLTWADVSRRVDALTVALHDFGLRKDDFLCVQLPTTHEVFLLYLAAMRLGLILTPVPFQYRAHELGQILDHLRPRAFVTACRIGRHDHATMALDLQKSRPWLDFVLVFGGDGPPGAQTLDRLETRETDAARAATLETTADVGADEVAVVLWSSGTESFPKPVPRSHNNLMAGRRLMSEGAALGEGCTILAPRLMNTVGGLVGALLPWLDRRARLVLHQPFDYAIYRQQLREERIEFTSMPPAILHSMLADPALSREQDLPALKAVSSGSAALPADVVKGFRHRFGVEVLNVYGSSEGGSLAAVPAEIPDEGLRAAFFPRYGMKDARWRLSLAAGVETKLVDRDTESVIEEAGRPGELRFRGANIFPGYYGMPDLTARSFDVDGFYRSGDLFEIAGPEDRFLRFVGRIKDVIVRGGMNISALEIEQLVAAHPDVAEAAVVGLPDARLGEIVCAAIVPKRGRSLTLEALCAWLAAEKQVAIFKLPQRLVLLEELPRSPAGKILKNDLRALASV